MVGFDPDKLKLFRICLGSCLSQSWRSVPILPIVSLREAFCLREPAQDSIVIETLNYLPMQLDIPNYGQSKAVIEQGLNFDHGAK